MTNNHHQSSTIIAERFIDAIAKIRAEVARVTSEQKAKVEAEAEERVSGYRKEITRLKKQIEQDSNAHAKEITKITSDAKASVAKEKARADKAAKQLAKAKAEIAKATAKEKAGTDAEEAGAETVKEVKSETSKKKDEVDTDSSDSAANAQ